MKIFARLFLIAILITTSSNLSAQDRYVVFLAQDGSASFRITLSDFYFYVSQAGRITDFGTFGSNSISYDINGKVDRIGSTSISYNISGRIDRVGNTVISYNINNQIDRIGTINISYNINNLIDRFSDKSFSYSINNKVERIGSSTISYDINGRVDRINDNEGFIIFRPKTAAIDF